MSKGSNRRPTQVSQQEADDNWDKIFGRKPTVEKTQEVPERNESELNETRVSAKMLSS